MQDKAFKGKVVLAGAGPGDPELITMKTVRYLQQADVVLSDRLVSDVILTNYVSPSAEIIHVGKQCRKGASTPQQTINELMLYYALQGKLVVRLKGGDVSVFSNILDELICLREAGIAYEIVPGITAALGAAAYGGIPLTARDHATAVRFLTFYQSDVISREKWHELAQTDDTLVFYMSAETLPRLVEMLAAAGIHPNKKLAVVEQATTPSQQVHVCSIYDYHAEMKNRIWISPTLVIIGRVVALHEKFSWIPNAEEPSEYFAQVAAKLLEYQNKRERA